MQVKRIPIATLSTAPHNPKSRTENNSRLRQLAKSMEKIGILYPILVSKDGKRVIDGHRRLAAAKRLGWDSIPVLMVNAESDDEVYSEVNANSCRLTGNQALAVWLKNPKAVTKRSRACFDRAEAILGRTILGRLSRGGHSVRLLTLAGWVARYVDRADDSKFIKKTTCWLAKYRNARIVEGYMEVKQSPKTLHRAIMANRDLKISYRAVG